MRNAAAIVLCLAAAGCAPLQLPPSDAVSAVCREPAAQIATELAEADADTGRETAAADVCRRPLAQILTSTDIDRSTARNELRAKRLHAIRVGLATAVP